jgi:hypothetical protein
MDNLFKAVAPPDNIQPLERDEIWIWKEPVPGHAYIIGADVARGDGEDYSAFCILDSNTSEVVADFKGKPPPDKFADLLMAYGYLYNTALICQELNNVGVAAAIKLKDDKYPNLFYEKFMKNMHMKFDHSLIGNELPGFTTNPNTRVEMLAKLENIIRNGEILLYSKRLYEELQTFIWKGNKPQAQKGYHDDLVMALAMACQMFEATAKAGPQYSSIEEAMALLKGMSRENKTMNSFTGQQTTQVSSYRVVSHGPITSEINKLNNEASSPNKPKDYSRFGPYKWLMED